MYPPRLCVQVLTQVPSTSGGTSAHNRPQGEGSMRRDTCSHCFLHKSSAAALKVMLERRRLLTRQVMSWTTLAVTEPEPHPLSSTDQHHPLQPPSIHTSSGKGSSNRRPHAAL